MRILIRSVIMTASFLTSLPAWAHHPMGNETPFTLLQGLVSGLAHPVIGIDHFAFVVALGVVAAFQTRRRLLPLGFVAGSFFGCLLFLQTGSVPLGELLIAASVLLMGIIAMRGKRIDTAPLLVSVTAAGLLHGTAYGSGIIGAEPTPLIAYLIGFSGVQLAIALAVMQGLRGIYQIHMPEHLTARLTGAVVVGVGATFLIENIEGLIFASL